MQPIHTVILMTQTYNTIDDHDWLYFNTTKEERADLLMFYESNKIARNRQHRQYEELKLFIQTNDQ